MPKVFLSSTVRDLGDMRSAVKYWLEEAGFEVLASEFSDFPYALDRDAVAASLVPIDECDYFVLIVGWRVGSLVPVEGISVTRAEFRRARETRRSRGRPGMLHLVRNDVAVARRIGKPEGTTDADWSAITDFLKEVESEGAPGDPNWLRSFGTFRDVVDVLRATLRVSGPLPKRALETNLIWELKDNARELLFRVKDNLLPQTVWFPKDAPQVAGVSAPVSVSDKDAYGLFRFRLGLGRMTAKSTSALEEAINSGQFLGYDVASSSLVVGPLHQCLLELRQQLANLSGAVKIASENEMVIGDVAKLAAGARDKVTVQVSEFTVRVLFGAYSAAENVLQLNRAIYRNLVGVDAEVQVPKMLPPYMSDEGPKIEAERITGDDADKWFRS